MADEQDVNVLYSKVNKLDTRLTKIESEHPFLKEILERNIKSNEVLSETLHEIQLSMVNLNNKMEDQAQAMDDMKQEAVEANQKTSKEIADINNKIDSIEEKGKFDIHLFIQHSWPWLTVIIGMGLLYATKYVNF